MISVCGNTDKERSRKAELRAITAALLFLQSDPERFSGTQSGDLQNRNYVKMQGYCKNKQKINKKLGEIVEDHEPCGKLT